MSTTNQTKTLSSKLLENKNKFEEVLKHKFFYVPSSEIYGGVAGLYDMGPIGAALETQILDIWRRHFIIEDSMMEIRSCQLTPYATLKASGHVDKFSDVMVKDTITHDYFRADHLIKNHIEKTIKDEKSDQKIKNELSNLLPKIESFDKIGLKKVIDMYQIKSPAGNILTDPIEFNLMFSTNIGPTGTISGFLRPETAQGIFVNFKRLLEFNNNKIPFAVAQIGFSFRNEISPRAGLIRCREFLMAEIEHFLHPQSKIHKKFPTVMDITANLYSSKCQLSNTESQIMNLRDAVDQKIIDNNVIAYYIGRTYLFLQKIGIDMNKVRFRQHLPDEKAHYACDCWDCEIHSFHGWVECVGIADRTCFDLCQHEKHSNQSLKFSETLSAPVKIKYVEIELNKSLIGRSFKQDSKIITTYLTTLNIQSALELKESLNNPETIIKVEDKEFKIVKEMITRIEILEKDVHHKESYPHVVEPSFGIGRILYSLLSHRCMYRVQDEQRIWFDFPISVAPYKFVILPLSHKQEFHPVVQQISDILSNIEVSYRVDDMSTTIGKRYSRSDELGIPYAITIDFDTLNNIPQTVTLRERNSSDQIRIEISDLPNTLLGLSRSTIQWSELVEKFGLFKGQTSIS